MLDNLTRDEEKTEGNKNEVLNKEAENIVKGARIQQRSIKENKIKKDTYNQNLKETDDIFWTHKGKHNSHKA